MNRKYEVVLKHRNERVVLDTSQAGGAEASEWAIHMLVLWLGKDVWRDNSGFVEKVMPAPMENPYEAARDGND